MHGQPQKWQQVCYYRAHSHVVRLGHIYMAAPSVHAPRVYSHFVNSHFVNSHFVNSHFVNSHLINFPLCQFPRSGKVYHFITSNHCYRSVNFLVHQSNVQEMTKLYGAPWVWWNSCQLSQTQEKIDFRGELTWTACKGRLPSSGHWANVPFATVSNLEKFYEAKTIYIDRTTVVLSALQSTCCV